MLLDEFKQEFREAYLSLKEFATDADRDAFITSLLDQTRNEVLAILKIQITDTTLLNRWIKRLVFAFLLERRGKITEALQLRESILKEIYEYKREAGTQNTTIFKITDIGG